MQHIIWNPLSMAKKAAWNNLKEPVTKLVKNLGKKALEMTAENLEYEETVGEAKQNKLAEIQASHKRTRESRKDL